MGTIITPPNRVGYAGQGGGSGGAYHVGALKALIESDLYQSGQIALCDFFGTSAQAINMLFFIDGINRGEPMRGVQNAELFWLRMGAIYMQTGHYFSAEHTLSMISNPIYVMREVFKTSVGAGFNGLSAITPPLDTIEAEIRKIIETEKYLYSADCQGTVNTTVFVNGAPERRIHSGADFTIKAALCAAALREIAPNGVLYKGEYHFDGAYSANPHIDIRGLEALFIATLNPVNPEMTDILSQADARRITPHGSSLMLSEIHGEALGYAGMCDIPVHKMGLSPDIPYSDWDKFRIDPGKVTMIMRAGEADMQLWLHRHAKNICDFPTGFRSMMSRPSQSLVAAA